jgi:hypothetical protein
MGVVFIGPQPAAIEVAVDSDRRNAEVSACTDNPNSDFTTVCDKDLFQHGL